MVNDLECFVLEDLNKGPAACGDQSFEASRWIDIGTDALHEACQFVQSKGAGSVGDCLENLYLEFDCDLLFGSLPC